MKVITLLLLSFPAFASEEAALGPFLRLLPGITASLEKDNQCWIGQESSGQTCSEISDKFCVELWDEHKGKTKVFDGQLMLGKSDKSKISRVTLIDHQALVDAERRLPEDLRIRAKPALARLRKTLKVEDETETWKRRLADNVRDFQRAVEDTAMARRDKLHPELKGMRLATMTAEETLKAKRVTAQLDDEVLEAKYKEHPNWKRVEALVPEAKKQLLEVIENLPISREKRELMVKRLSTVQLSLPYVNPEKLDSDADCPTSMDNAFYNGEFHKITICAGLFNAYQSSTALIQTVLHELAHSVDPNSLDSHDCRTHGKINGKLKALAGAKGPALSCEKWEEMRAEIESTLIPPPRKTELDKLYACLERGVEIQPRDERRVAEESRIDANAEMQRLAQKDHLLDIATPAHIFKGKPTENEFYLRPDRVILSAANRPSDFVPSEMYGPEADAREIFTQVLSCQKVKRGNQELKFTDKEITKAERAKMFRAASEITTSVLAKANEEAYSFCGDRCPGLKLLGVSRATGEHFADWMATKVIWRQLIRVPAGKDRLHAAAVATAGYCDQAGSERSEPEMALEAKKISKQQHPVHYRRKNAQFDDVSAGIIGCKLEPEKLENFGVCEP